MKRKAQFLLFAIISLIILIIIFANINTGKNNIGNTNTENTNTENTNTENTNTENTNTENTNTENTNTENTNTENTNTENTNTEMENVIQIEDGSDETIRFDTIAATTILPPGSNGSALHEALRMASSGDTIIISSDMEFDREVLVPAGKTITLEAASENYTLTKYDFLMKHFRVDGTLILQNVNMHGSGFSGGILVSESGTLIINDGTIIQKNLSYFGGAIENHGIVNIYGGEIKNNTAIAYGGAICQLGTLNVYSGSIEGNSAKDGGAMYLASDSVTNISGSTSISNNTCTGNGGVLFVDIAAKLNVTGNNSFSSNTAEKNGGAIYTEDTTYKNITIASSTTFSENQAPISTLPPANAASLYPNIGFTGTSIYDHPLNNYDINYTVSSVHVTYDANGGTGSYIGPDIQVSYTDTVLSIIDTGISNLGYAFMSWNTLADGSGTSYQPGDSVTLNNNITLYAQWKKSDQLTVTFDSNGGTPVEMQRVTFDDRITKPTDPTKEGYNFSGWYTDNQTFKNEWNFNTIVTESITLYAKWMADEYTATFESNGGTPIDSQTVSADSSIIRPADPTRQGYTFGGWYTDNETFQNEWDFNTIVTEDITLYARWTANQYTVTFESNGGTQIDVQTVSADGRVTRPADPTKKNYIFDGWYTDNETFQNEWDFNTPITENITLYAKWRINPSYVLTWTLIIIFIVLLAMLVFCEKIKKTKKCNCKHEKCNKCNKCKK